MPSATGLLSAPDLPRRRILTPIRLRALRHGLTAMGLAFSLEFLLIAATGQWFGDAHIYWYNTPTTMYVDYHVGFGTGYAYAPAFAQVLYPLHVLLAWPVFSALWSAMLLAVLWWLLRGTPWIWALPLALLAIPDVLIGNVHLLVAAAVVVGFALPASWAFVLLTKLTPGVGLLWFVVRREWSTLALALVATAAIVAASLLLDRGLWTDWIAAIWANRDAQGAGVAIVPGLIIRLPLAGALVWWGARSGRRWTVLVAAFLALPHIWIQSAAMFAALPRLLAQEQRARHVSKAANVSIEDYRTAEVT